MPTAPKPARNETAAPAKDPLAERQYGYRIINSTPAAQPAHSPTPWLLSHDLGNGYSIAREIAPGAAHGRLLPIALAVYSPGTYREEENMRAAKANAAHIVHCVNSHASLTERAEKAESGMELQGIKVAHLSAANASLTAERDALAKERDLLREDVSYWKSQAYGMEAERDHFKSALEKIHAGETMKGRTDWTHAEVIQAHYAICRAALALSAKEAAK